LAVHVASSLDYQVLSESAQTENHAENPGWHVAKLVQQSCHRWGNVIRSNNTGRKDFSEIFSRKSGQRKILRVPSRRFQQGYSISQFSTVVYTLYTTTPCTPKVGRASAGFQRFGGRASACHTQRAASGSPRFGHPKLRTQTEDPSSPKG
jgi:hypothetical protein